MNERKHDSLNKLHKLKSKLLLNASKQLEYTNSEGKKLIVSI